MNTHYQFGFTSRRKYTRRARSTEEVQMKLRPRENHGVLEAKLAARLEICRSERSQG